MPEALPSVPSSTALETIGYMLWMMIEPLGAALNAYEPWTVALIALVLGFVPMSRRLTLLKVLASAIMAMGVYAFGPLTIGLTPVWPDALTVETYIQMALFIIEAGVVIGLVHMLIDGFKGLTATSGMRRASRPETAGLIAFRPSAFADKASVNFAHRVASPMSQALSHTLSVAPKL